MISETKNYQIDPSLFRKQPTKTMENQAGQANPEASKARLKTAVKELEALFIYEMLKEMRQTSQGGFLGKGLGNDIYNSLFDMEVARLAAAGRGLGLGEMILRQMDGQKGKDGHTPLPSSKSPQGASLNQGESLISPPALKPKDQSPEPSTRMPVEDRMPSAFGWKAAPFSGKEKFHSGLDITPLTGREIHSVKKK